MAEQWKAFLLNQWQTHWAAWTYFAVGLTAAWFVSWAVKYVLKNIIHRFTSRTDSNLDDRIVAASAGPVRATVLMLGVNLALNGLQNRMAAFQEGGRFAAEFQVVDKIAGALVILTITRLLLGIFRAVLDWFVETRAVGNDRAWDEQLLPLVRRIASLMLYFIAITIILDMFEIQITALITTAGVASLAVALAAQETLSNMLGGFVILVDRPFRIGDVIELADGKMGEVIEIGLRSTRIRQFDGNAMVIPNKDIANTRVINFALPTPRAAIRQTIGVDYGTDIEKAKQVLLDTLNAHPEVLDDPAPGVWFTKFGESSLDLFCSCWVETFRNRFRVTDELNVQILKAFRENGISIPFPQRDVHLFVKANEQEKLPAKGSL